MKTQPLTVIFTFRIDAKTKSLLEEQAALEDRTLGALTRKIIREQLRERASQDKRELKREDDYL